MRYFLALAAAVVVVLLAARFVDRGSLFGNCQVIASRKITYSENRSILQEIINCGSLDSFYTTLRISNIPLGGDGERDFFLGVEGRYELAIEWKSYDRLSVRLPVDAEIFRRADIWDGLKIEYE